MFTALALKDTISYFTACGVEPVSVTQEPEVFAAPGTAQGGVCRGPPSLPGCGPGLLPTRGSRAGLAVTGLRAGSAPESGGPRECGACQLLFREREACPTSS